MQVSNIQFPNYRTKDRNYNSEKKKSAKDELLKKSLESVFDYSDAEKQQLNSSISAKAKSGAKLTPREMQFLQKTNPMLYMKMMMLQKKREILEQKLKNCKSKKEVNDVITFEMNLVRDSDPDKELKIKSIQDMEKEFKKTQEYKQLPETVKKTDDKKRSKASD